MIINVNRQPKYSLFYIGYEILKQLQNKNGMSIEQIYDIIRKKIDDNIHIDFIYYALDWLYIVSLNTLKGEKVFLCY